MGTGASTKLKYVVDSNVEELSGPTCFFCQAIATCKVCVGDGFQCVCEECRSWRLREKMQSPSIRKKKIQPSRSTFLEERLGRKKITTKSSALDFFVEGKVLSNIEQVKEVSNTITENSANNVINVNNCNQNTNISHTIADDRSCTDAVRQNDIDDATKALILAIQKQDQEELEQEQQLQKATEAASLAAIKAIQEQDAVEEQEMINQRKIENERMLQMKAEQEERERQQKLETDKLQIREEEMLLAAIRASQLEAQIQEEQFSEMQEPLSWKAPRKKPNNSINNSNNADEGDMCMNEETENHYVPALGERHCRQRGCACMQFDEDVTRPTVCKCGHGEMYHRLDSEAPLARANIPGIAKCADCNKDIVCGNGFSGWYNEVQGANGKLVHVECWERYKDTISAKCVQCSQPLRRKEGLFSGRYKKLGGGKKCHKECFVQYKIDAGDFCDICNEALLREYVVLQDGSAGLKAHKDGKVYVHKDCWHKHLRGGGNGHSNYKRTIVNQLK